MPKIANTDVSRETMDRLRAFEALTLKWTQHINLIAKSTISDIWDRHIVDSVQIFDRAPDFDTWVDIGSGGGYPGIVIAAIAAESQPNAQFTLIESDKRKATFLRTAARELSLSVKIINARIEEAPPQIADVVSARALGALSMLLPLADRHLASDGTALLMKGRQHQEELDDVMNDWDFDLTAYPSITDPDSRILSFQRITRVA